MLLPLSVEQVIEQADKTMPLSTLPTGVERVVLLAPDEAVRATVRQILQVLGYEVVVTGGDEELIEALTAKRADLLIIDGPARDDGGLVGARAVGEPGDENRRHCGRAALAGDRTGSASGVGVLAKPFSLAELAGVVRQSLDARGDAPARS